MHVFDLYYDLCTNASVICWRLLTYLKNMKHNEMNELFWFKVSTYKLVHVMACVLILNLQDNNVPPNLLEIMV